MPGTMLIFCTRSDTVRLYPVHDILIMVKLTQIKWCFVQTETQYFVHDILNVMSVIRINLYFVQAVIIYEPSSGSAPLLFLLRLILLLLVIIYETSTGAAPLLLLLQLISDLQDRARFLMIITLHQSRPNTNTKPDSTHSFLHLVFDQLILSKSH